MVKKWLPLESNPDVFDEFAQQLGLHEGIWSFSDVLGLDEEMLGMVPQPAIAVMMLYPITEKTEAARIAEAEKLREAGQSVSDKVYYMKQTISNACGTIALLHALGNNQDKISVEEGSFFQRFFAGTAKLTPAERAAYLENPPAGAPNLDDAHASAAAGGQTAPPALDEVVDLHFMTLVIVDGMLYELDGRKEFPINHGPSSADQLLQSAAQVVKRYVAETNSMQFSLLALAAADH